MNELILTQTQIDHNAPSVHSGYDYNTNRILDTLLFNWAFEDECAAFFSYDRKSNNARANEAARLYEAAKREANEQAALRQVEAEIAAMNDYDGSMRDASIYAQV